MGAGGIAGSGRIFPDPGFDQNTVQHSGNVDGKRDLTASEEAGFAKICVRMRDWERKRNDVRNIVYRGTGRGILVKKEKECGIRPPRPFSDLSVEGSSTVRTPGSNKYKLCFGSG